MTSEQLLQLSRGMSAERLLLLLLIPLVSSQFGYQELLSAKAGQDVTLPCLGPRVEQKVVFQWIRTGGLLDLYVILKEDQVLFSRNNQEAFRGRLKLREPSSMKGGDFSLTLQNVDINDEGGYRCVIRYVSPGGDYVRFTRSITLNISEADQRLQQETSSSYETWSYYETDDSQFIIITVSVSLASVVLLLCVIFLIRYRKSVRGSKLRSSQRSRELSQSKDDELDF